MIRRKPGALDWLGGALVLVAELRRRGGHFDWLDTRYHVRADEPVPGRALIRRDKYTNAARYPWLPIAPDPPPPG